MSHFIQTKTKPHIFYLPSKHTPESERRLQETKDKYRCKPNLHFVLALNLKTILFFDSIVIVAEKRAKVQKELSEIDELYKKEEQNEAIDEEMDEMDVSIPNQKSDENQIEEKTKNELTLESNNRVISSDNSSQNEVSKQITIDTKSDDTSNGLNNYTKMESPEEQTIEDKEFEPIYDP